MQSFDVFQKLHFEIPHFFFYIPPFTSHFLMFAIKNLLTEIGFARVKTVTPLDMSHFSVNEDKFEIAFNQLSMS